jgi:hypothetical protein
VVAVVGRDDDGRRIAAVSLLGRPEIFRGLFKRRAKESGTDVLGHIEFPLWISAVGIPIFSVLGAWTTHAFFGVPWLLAFISLPLIFVLSVICTNSMALTSWTPTGALSKITQFTMGAIDRSNPASNLIPAGMTAEIASNAANLLSDIKPGYMLGGKPRQQAIGHVIGIFAGAIACVPLFFLLFLQPDANGVRSVSTMVSDNFAFPAALQWKGVAELIAKGVSALPYSAVVSMIVAAVAAVTIEVARMVTRGRFPLSAVSIGLGVVLPPESTFAMWIGAMIFWVAARRNRPPAPTQPVLGRGHGAHLRRTDLRLRADGDRQRDRQRADGLSGRAPFDGDRAGQGGAHMITPADRSPRESSHAPASARASGGGSCSGDWGRPARRCRADNGPHVGGEAPSGPSADTPKTTPSSCQSAFCRTTPHSLALGVRSASCAARAWC